jgi:hypothetical protein
VLRRHPEPAAAPTPAGFWALSRQQCGPGREDREFAGHHYESRRGDKGHFINRTGNPRDGEDFQIVQRGGRTFHVYGNAKDHNVYELPHASKAASTVPDSGGTPAA